MRIVINAVFGLMFLTAVAVEPLFHCRSNAIGNIQYMGREIVLDLRFENRGAFAGEFTELLRICDVHGNGQAPEIRHIMLEQGSILTRRVTIPADYRGMFRIVYSLMCDGELFFSRSITGIAFTPVEQLDPTGSPIGMYCHNVQINGKQELPVLKKMGIRWIRANLLWELLEPKHGSFDWSSGDASYNALTDNDMNIMYNLVYPPRWAVNRVNIYGGNPADFEQFAAFAARAAARYPAVKHWSVWNEPDAESHWEGGGAEFARLLKVIAPAIRTANPAAKILPGGVTGSPPLAERFYRDLQRADARPFFDIYEYHYRNVDLHRKLMREFGWENMPLWNTEAAEGEKGAAHLVREVISGFAAGVKRTFVFLYAIEKKSPADFEEFGPVVMVDNEGRPTENFPEVYTMSREINGIRSCEDRSGKNLALFVWRNLKGEERYILWGKGDTRAVTLRSSGPLRVVDAVGNERILSPFDGYVSVPATEVTYLNGAEVIPAGEPMAELGNPCSTPVFGTEFQIPVRFHNPSSRPFRGKALLAASPDWEISTVEIPLELPPGESRKILCRLKTRRLTDASASRLTLQLFREDGALSACDQRDINLATALGLSLRSAFRWGEPRVRALINNPTAAPIEAEIRFRSFGKNGKTAAMPVTLPPLTASSVYFNPGLKSGEVHGRTEALLTYPGGAVRRVAELDWIALKPAGNPPIVLNRRTDYIAPSRILFQWEGPQDLSVKAKLGWNPEHLLFFAEVTDDVHSAETDPGLLWQRDSIQFWFDGMLFDLGLASKGAVLHRHDVRSKQMKIPFSVTRQGNVTRYQIAFPRPDGKQWRENDTVAFAFIVNDADRGAERKGWMHYLSDIGEPRCRAATPEITLVKE